MRRIAWTTLYFPAIVEQPSNWKSAHFFGMKSSVSRYAPPSPPGNAHVYRYNWEQPCRNQRPFIDLIIVRKTSKTITQDVRVYRHPKSFGIREISIHGNIPKNTIIKRIISWKISFRNILSTIGLNRGKNITSNKWDKNGVCPGSNENNGGRKMHKNLRKKTKMKIDNELPKNNFFFKDLHSYCLSRKKVYPRHWNHLKGV